MQLKNTRDDERVPFFVRLPRHLRREAKELAARREMSLQEAAEMLLRRWVESEGNLGESEDEED